MTSIATQGEAGADGWFVSQVTVSLVPEDLGSGVDHTLCQLDGGPWMNYSNPLAVSDEGIHNLRYYSVDVAGNEAQIMDLELMLDLASPSTSIVLEGMQGTNGWYVSIVDISLSAYDELSGPFNTSWRLDGGLWAPYIGSTPVPSMGSHTLEYRSMDRAGNWEEPRSTTFKIDSDAPTVKLNGTSKPFTSKDVTLHFDAKDNISVISLIKVKLDGGQETTIDHDPWDLEERELSDGWHDLEITVYDDAGNNLSQVIRFKVDTNPLSFEGPNGPLLLMGIAALAIAGVIMVVMIRKRKNG
jgi:hypothetical protein